MCDNKRGGDQTKRHGMGRALGRHGAGQERSRGPTCSCRKWCTRMSSMATSWSRTRSCATCGLSTSSSCRTRWRPSFPSASVNPKPAAVLRRRTRTISCGESWQAAAAATAIDSDSCCCCDCDAAIGGGDRSLSSSLTSTERGSATRPPEVRAIESAPGNARSGTPRSESCGAPFDANEAIKNWLMIIIS